MTPPDVSLCPYRGLGAYRAEDTALFFGRDRESEIIAANLIASPLTILYGPSGVGKSSVLSAGVGPYIDDLSFRSVTVPAETQFHLMSFSSWRDEPLPKLKTAITQAMSDRTTLSTAQSLADTLGAVSASANTTLLIVLDQFEEYFLYHSDEAGPGTFAFEFPHAVGQRGLPAHFLISIREESLARLDRFKGKIHGLFSNYLRLEHLSREAATSAICNPIHAYNRLYSTRLRIEDGLVHDVLDQTRAGQLLISYSGLESPMFGPGKFEAPYLQLIMSRLWEEEMRTSSQVFTSQTLRRLGGAKTIVRTHVDSVLDRCSPEEQNVASGVFHYLVTPTGTKIAQTLTDLAAYTNIPERKVYSLLEQLSTGSTRLLAPVAGRPGQIDVPRYEIFHDILAPSVLDWRARYLEATKQAKHSRDLAVIQSAASAGDPRQLAMMIAENVRDILAADSVVMYEYIGEEQCFKMPPTMAGTFFDRASLEAQVAPPELLRWLMDKEIYCVLDAQNDHHLARARRDAPRFVHREAIASCLIVSLCADKEIVGILFANFRSARQFAAYEVGSFAGFASAVAVAIKSVRTRERLNRESAQRRRVTDAVTATAHQISWADEDAERKLGEIVLGQALQAVRGSIGVIYRHNQATNELEVLSTVGRPLTEFRYRLGGRGIPHRAAQARKTILVPDVYRDPHYVQLFQETRSELAAPLFDGDGLIGVLDIQAFEVNHFADEDRYLLDSLATHTSLAFRNIRILGRLKQQFSAQLGLSHVLAWIAQSDATRDTLLRCILTGVTAGEGLGFSRAALLALDQERRHLVGLAGVGSLTVGEAHSTWAELVHGASTLPKLLENIGETGSVVNVESSFANAVLRMRIPLEENSTVTRCALASEPVLVPAFEPDSLRELLGDAGRYPLLCVPIMASHSEVQGVLVVDNRFLPTEGLISVDAVPGLQAFAALAALILRRSPLGE